MTQPNTCNSRLVAQLALVLGLVVCLVFLVVSRKQLQACEIRHRKQTEQQRHERERISRQLQAERGRVAELELSLEAIDAQIESLRQATSGSAQGGATSAPAPN